MSVLVVLEQQGGQWHRMSWETLAAGQQFGAALGEPVEAAVVGKGIGALANEAATKKLAKVWAVEHDLLDSYTADGYTAALEAADSEGAAEAGAVPAHLSGARLRAQAGDAIFAGADQRRDRGARGSRSAHVFVRQFFQGKLNGDVRVSGAGPRVRIDASRRVARGRAGKRLGAGGSVRAGARRRRRSGRSPKLRSAKRRARWI